MRLTREKNKPPISTALTFTTAENTVLTGPDVKFKSTDQESPNNLQHTILVTAAGVTPAFASPVYGTITNVGTNQFSPLFMYTPKPFHNGVENLRYYATDAHGATSDPVDLIITVTAVNNAPVGACAPSSAMDADVQVKMIAAVTASKGEELRKAVAVKAAADVGNIRATFVSYAAVGFMIQCLLPVTSSTRFTKPRFSS